MVFKMQVMAYRRISLYWICSVFFLLSGFSALIYEVIWFKRFSYVWGSSTLAMASVVGSFLFGLGLGAHLVGRLADHSKSPFLWYAVCECAIGILAFSVPYEIHWLHQVSSALYPVLQDHPLTHHLARFAFTFLVIGPPCILMGGTLPLLIRQFTPPGSSLNAMTGWLYAINTMGAAFGCYLAGFHLLPSIGLHWSNMLAVATNLIVGIAGLLTTCYLKAQMPGQYSLPHYVGNPKPMNVTKSTAVNNTQRLYFSVAITGFASLVLQMIWVRQLSLILGGSTYAFTAVLFVFLVGIGVGSFCFHIWLRKFSDLSYTPALVIMGVVVFTGIGYYLIPHLTFTTGLLKPLRSSQISNAVVCITASSLLELLPAIGMGLLFPIFVHLTRMRSENAGKAVGNVYAWNTLGCIAGASVTSVLLVPTLGVPRTIGLALLLYLFVLLIQLPKEGRRNIPLRILFTALAAVVIFLVVRPFDPRITDHGMYLYGYKKSEELVSESKILDFSEGSSCNVLVLESRRNNERSVRINGKVTSGALDMPTQVGLAYFPRFLLPKAQKVLNIGFGSGTTAGASLLFPGTEVTCCEIEPAVFAASKYFSKLNHKPEHSTRFTIILDDGRNYIQGTKEKFDIIISEPSNPWIAGVSNLFTKEFYETVRPKLNRNGILAQWIRLYSSSSCEYAMIVKTVQSVFSHYALIRISDSDTIMITSDSPLGINEENVRASQSLVDSQDAVRADLKKYFGSTDVAILLFKHIILDQKGLVRLTENDDFQLINTDINMRLEYDAPLHMFEGSRLQEDTIRALLRQGDIRWFRNSFHRLGLSRNKIDAVYDLAHLYAKKEIWDLAVQITDLGLEIDTTNRHLVALKQVLELSQDTKLVKENLSHITYRSAKQVSRLAVKMWQSQKYSEAASVFEKLLSIYPNSARSWTNLAINYQALGRRHEAEQAFKKAVFLDPLDDFAVNSYEAFLKRSGCDGESEGTERIVPVATSAQRSISTDSQNIDGL